MSVALLVPLAMAMLQDPPPAAPAGGDGFAERMQLLQREIDALRRKSLEQEERSRAQDDRIRQLEAETGERWLTEQRAEQVRAVVRDVLSDSSQRASLQQAGATSGYDRNFYIASADGNFRLNLEGQIQVRYAYDSLPTDATSPTSEPDQYGFELRRMQIALFGNMFDKSVTYRVQLQYQRDASLGADPIRWADVWMQKALGGGYFVRAGQWKNLYNYEDETSSRTQQLVERSIVNDYFNTKFIQGVLVGWESDQMRLFGSFNDGGANRDTGVTQLRANLTDWAFTGRVEWKPVGDWGQIRDMQGWVGSPFALQFGAGVNVQRAGGNPAPERQAVGNGTIIASVGSGGSATPAVTDVMSLLSWTADVNLRGSGWSAWGAFLGNSIYSGGEIARQLGVNGTLSLGAVVQGGVFLAEELELVARWEGLWVSSDFPEADYRPNALNSQTVNIVTLGANWYFNKNQLKFQIDGGYAFNPVLFQNGLFGENIAGANYRPSANGPDVGAGQVVIRGQLQLLF
jgi:hypothetical protein